MPKFSRKWKNKTKKVNVCWNFYFIVFYYFKNNEINCLNKRNDGLVILRIIKNIYILNIDGFVILKKIK